MVEGAQELGWESVTHTIGIHHKDVLSVLAFRANRREKKKQQQQGMVGDDP